ncbi:hypothetical protein NHX12_023260, partial [Muraenolepis orangiensis]
MCGKKRGLVGMVREKMREENCAGKDTAELREQKFLCELAFLCDISSHLDALNLQLQGRGRIITDMYAAFAEKLSVLAAEFSRRFADFDVQK